MSGELIISVLKEYIQSSDYHLHDWETITERAVEVKDGVFSYPCVYADIWLTDELEFYDAIPKQPIHNDISISDDLSIIASVLMEYVPPSDYHLHDWNSIIQRRTEVKDGVFSYPCVYADIWLTDELEFYDAIPKQPIHNLFGKGLDEYEKLVVDVLRECIPYKYLGDVDWKTVLSRKEEVKPNTYKYVVNNIDFYLDGELNPVEYGKVHIIDDCIYYDFERDSSIEYDAYELFCEIV